MGRFRLRPGRQSYTLTEAEIEQSFLKLTEDVERFASASYCCELTEYFTREGLGGKDELNLLYVSFLALLEERLSPEVIRAAFGIKLLDIEGEYPHENCPAVVQYILAQPIGGTFSFVPKERAEQDLIRSVKKVLDRTLDYPMRSEEVLRGLEESKRGF